MRSLTCIAGGADDLTPAGLAEASSKWKNSDEKTVGDFI
jgi:hypothetical protein